MHHQPTNHFLPPSGDGATPIFLPAQTVRCTGLPSFRSQAARDAGCLLDVDPGVVSWTCTTSALVNGVATFIPDFEVTRVGTVELLALADGPDRVSDWVMAAARERGTPIEILSPSDLAGTRLVNARELLRYASWRVSLSDRVRLLAALDEEGSLTLAEAMTAFRATADPIAAVAALTLHRFLDLDLDSGRIGPETRVARWRY